MYLPYNVRRVFEKASKYVRDKSVLVVSHKDADGFLSYALLKKFLPSDVNGMFFNTLTPEIINNLPKDFDVYIFADIGNSFEKEIFGILNNKSVLILEHHHSSYDKILHDSNHLNINAYLLSIDGNKEITSTGLAYLLCTTENKYALNDHFYIPFTSAFGDMQIKDGVKGYNSLFMHNALARGEISKINTLLLPAWSIKPLYKSIEMFMNEKGIPYTSNDALLFLKRVGIVPYKIEMLRKIPVKASDLSDEEVRILATHLAIELEEKGVEYDEILKETYIIKNKYLIQEFTTLINAAIKMNYIKEGFSLVYEMKDIYYIYDIYRREVGKAYNIAYNSLRTKNNIVYYIFNKNQIKDSSLTGTIASMLNNKVNKEIIFVGYIDDETLKFSLRSKNISIGELIREFCKKTPNCYGNGHEKAGGGIIHKDYLNTFLEFLDNKTSLL